MAKITAWVVQADPVGVAEEADERQLVDDRQVERQQDARTTSSAMRMRCVHVGKIARLATGSWCSRFGAAAHRHTRLISGVPNRPYGRTSSTIEHHDVGDDQLVAGAERVGVLGEVGAGEHLGAARSASPPTSAPATESSPPRMTAGSARKASAGDRRRGRAAGRSVTSRRRSRRRTASAARRTPGDGEHPADRDALGQRRLLVEGDGAHGDAGPRAEEEVDARRTPRAAAMIATTHDQGIERAAELEAVGAPRDAEAAVVDARRRRCRSCAAPPRGRA